MGIDFAFPRRAVATNDRGKSTAQKSVGRAAGLRSLASMAKWSEQKCLMLGKGDRAKLPTGHLLGHVEYQLAIPLFHFAQQATKLVEKACIFADAAPGDVIRRLPLGEIRQYGRLFAVIKELIEWALESACQLLQCFDGRDSMTILNTGNITTEQAGTLFDVALG